MKTALPFKSQPKQEMRLVGNEDTGILEFPVYNSLLWHEQQAVRRIDREFNFWRESVLTASEICKEEEGAELSQMSLEVMAICTFALGAAPNISENGARIRLHHAEKLDDLMNRAIAWNDKRQLAAVTSLIQNRLEGFQDWDEVLVNRHLTTKLLAQIYEFFSSEENAMTAAQDDERVEIDEAAEMGKSPTEPGDPPPSPTGEGSTGASSSSTPEPESSAGSDSEASPSPASSTPSKEEKRKSVSAST